MPTVSIDTSQTPNMIAISGMAAIPAGTYSYTINAQHKDQETDPVSYTLEIVVLPDPCSSAIVSVPV